MNFFVLRKLALSEDLPKTAIFVGLIYLALSRPAVHYDSHLARVFRRGSLRIPPHGVRTALDVDAIAEITSYGEYAGFGEQLRSAAGQAAT
jgi:hypothetical protein